MSTTINQSLRNQINSTHIHCYSLHVFRTRAQKENIVYVHVHVHVQCNHVFLVEIHYHVHVLTCDGMAMLV